MIYLNIRGRLGNQLFEYACARNLQEKFGHKICINTYDLNKYSPDFEYDLDKYILNENIVVENKKPFPWYANNNFIIIKILRKIFKKKFVDFFGKFGIYLWFGEEYIVIKNHKNIYLDGYWQSEKYFQNIENILKQELVPKCNHSEKNKKLYDLIENSESVCITIRRGNYISNLKFKKILYICNEEYFQKAIKLIKEKIKNPTFFIFSDDVEWVKNNLKIDGTVYYEDGNDPAYEKLRLMSKCKHFIISNSSFSWWAQYLSTTKNKIVIAPSKWYTDNRKVDIYQEFWNLIEIGGCNE